MAAVQGRRGSYRVQFNYNGRQLGFTIGKVSEAEARAKAAQVDYLLMRLKQGLIEIPTGVDAVKFFRHDRAPPVAGTSSLGRRSNPNVASAARVQ